MLTENRHNLNHIAFYWPQWHVSLTIWTSDNMVRCSIHNIRKWSTKNLPKSIQAHNWTHIQIYKTFVPMLWKIIIRPGKFQIACNFQKRNTQQFDLLNISEIRGTWLKLSGSDTVRTSKQVWNPSRAKLTRLLNSVLLKSRFLLHYLY